VSPDIGNDRTENVPPALLRRYLMTHGWKLAEPPGRAPPALSINASGDVSRQFFYDRSAGKRNVDVYLLSESGYDDIELIVPRDRSSSDFERRMHGAILTLSQVEDKNPDEIITSIRSIGFDLVRSRIPDILVTDDTIHLESARNYINGMKDLLAATATTEIKPLPFFGRQYKEATEYSEKCRFGHTYRGSFGFTIESPLSAADTEKTLFDFEPAPPFERRVVQRLAIGIQHVCESVDSGDVAPLVDGFRNGFGANGCDRFASLVHSTAYSGMSFGFIFSPEWRLPAMLRSSVEFSVGPRHVEMARAAAQALRGESLEVPAEISGMVVRLQNEADPSDLSAIMGEGEISVLYSSEYGDIHVRVTLPPPEYLKAVQAHSLGRAVSVSGTLVHRGRYWYLNNPSSLSVPHQGELNL
jgi:hypothetical protein